METKATSPKRKDKVDSHFEYRRTTNNEIQLNHSTSQ